MDSTTSKESAHLDATRDYYDEFSNRYDDKRGGRVHGGYHDLIDDLELEFLEKVSSFVTQYCDDEDYSQKMWPQKETSKGDPKKKTMSPGKSYIEHKGEAEWFARSIEADSYEAQKQINELEKRKRQDTLTKKSRSVETSAQRPHLSSTSSTDRQEFQSKSKYSRIR